MRVCTPFSRSPVPPPKMARMNAKLAAEAEAIAAKQAEAEARRKAKEDDALKALEDLKVGKRAQVNIHARTRAEREIEGGLA